MPEKYGDFHNQLLGGQGRASEATAMKIALSLGADEAKLREEMKNPAINAAFEKTYDLANKLAITGTPSYVVGNEVVFGALGPGGAGPEDCGSPHRLDAGFQLSSFVRTGSQKPGLWTAKLGSCALFAAD